MASKATQVKLKVTAIDQATAVFRRVGSTALSVGKTFAVAFAAVGATVAKAAKHLGELSDQAMRSGTSVSEITKLSQAFEQLGLKGGDMESLSMAFQRMAARTGRVGMEGFTATIDEISKMPDAMDRSKAAMETFGRSGLNFMPLIEEQAKNAGFSIGEVADAMYGVSDSAAASGDAIADAMSQVTNTITGLFYDGIGEICRTFDEDLTGGAREASIMLGVYIEKGCKVCYRYILKFSENAILVFRHITANWSTVWRNAVKILWESIKAIGEMLWEWLKEIGAIFKRLGQGIKAAFTGDDFDWGSVLGEASFAKHWNRMTERIRYAVEDNPIMPEGLSMEIDTSDLDAKIEATREKAKKVAKMIGEFSGASPNASGRGLPSHDSAPGASSNSLIFGGSYASMTLGVRRQTDMAKMARNTDDMKKYLATVASNTASLGDMEVM